MRFYNIYHFHENINDASQYDDTLFSFTLFSRL